RGVGAVPPRVDELLGRIGAGLPDRLGSARREIDQEWIASGQGRRAHRSKDWRVASPAPGEFWREIRSTRLAGLHTITFLRPMPARASPSLPQGMAKSIGRTSAESPKWAMSPGSLSVDWPSTPAVAASGREGRTRRGR